MINHAHCPSSSAIPLTVPVPSRRAHFIYHRGTSNKKGGRRGGSSNTNGATETELTKSSSKESDFSLRLARYCRDHFAGGPKRSSDKYRAPNLLKGSSVILHCLFSHAPIEPFNFYCSKPSFSFALFPFRAPIICLRHYTCIPLCHRSHSRHVPDGTLSRSAEPVPRNQFFSPNPEFGPQQ